MRRLFAWIFRKPLVWTRDIDGDVRLRLARYSPWNEYTVYGIGFSRRGVLQKDGSVYNGSYVKNWKPANKYAERLFK